MEKRIENLIKFSQNIYHNKNIKELYNKYLNDIQEVTPMDVFEIENEQLKLGLSPKEMVSFVDKLINVFYKGLSQFQWEKPKEGTFLYFLMEENKGLKKELELFKVIIKKQDYETNREAIKESLVKLQSYNHHMVKLENILFPYMEKKRSRFNGLKIMWSLHDEIRTSLKKLLQLMHNNDYEFDSFNKEIGRLFFGLFGLIQKQELILFPAATLTLDEEDFKAMHKQSFEYPFVFIDPPSELLDDEPKISLSKNNNDQSMVHMKTGSLSLEQVELMINTLPVDITFVDEYDKVKFFSNPTDRTFPRSIAIIGRDVRNCHPPESVHIVEAIIDDFKHNIKDQENFWLKMKGLFILIQYFAVRNKDGKYLGTLEVSQEVTNIRSLEGEKRLLD